MNTTTNIMVVGIIISSFASTFDAFTTNLWLIKCNFYPDKKQSLADDIESQAPETSEAKQPEIIVMVLIASWLGSNGYTLFTLLLHSINYWSTQELAALDYWSQHYTNKPLTTFSTTANIEPSEPVLHRFILTTMLTISIFMSSVYIPTLWRHSLIGHKTAQLAHHCRLFFQKRVLKDGDQLPAHQF